VVDYIGNHRLYLVKAQTLFDLPAGRQHVFHCLEEVQAGEWPLPPGCEVTYELEAIEILEQLSQPPGSQDLALRRYYEDFRELQGQRPTASEAHHDGYKPRSVRAWHGSWLGFVQEMGDLPGARNATFDAHRSFLSALETTEMTRSFKMLVLKAMLDADQLPGAMSIDALSNRVRSLAHRTPRLADEFGGTLDDPAGLREFLERNPIEAWTGGRGFCAGHGRHAHLPPGLPRAAPAADDRRGAPAVAQHRARPASSSPGADCVQAEPRPDALFKSAELGGTEPPESPNELRMRDRDEILRVEHARPQDGYRDGDLESGVSRARRVGHDRHQGPVDIVGRHADHHGRPHLGRHAQINEPDLASLRRHCGCSRRSSSRNSWSAAATKSVSEGRSCGKDATRRTSSATTSERASSGSASNSSTSFCAACVMSSASHPDRFESRSVFARRPNTSDAA
jgi:hypothetical protein